MVTLAAYKHEPIDGLIVVDNASLDGTAEWLRHHLPDSPTHHLICLPDNVGGAGGFHAGLRWVDKMTHGKGWVLVHDDDAYPSPGVTQAFKNRLRSGHYSQYTAVAASVVSPLGQPADINRPILNIFRHPSDSWRRVRGRIMTMRDLYHVPNADIVSGNATYRVHAASFVGLYVNLSKLPNSDSQRYPCKDLFIYGDDTIYTANLDRLGRHILFDASLRFIHDTQTGYELGVLRPEWKQFYISRNSFLVYRSISAWAGVLLYAIALFRRLRKILGYRDRDLRIRSLRGYTLGMVDAMRGRTSRPHDEVVALVAGSQTGRAPC
jgi:GT2 family glycosyltransferase